MSEKIPRGEPPTATLGGKCLVDTIRRIDGQYIWNLPDNDQMAIRDLPNRTEFYRPTGIAVARLKCPVEECKAMCFIVVEKGMIIDPCSQRTADIACFVLEASGITADIGTGDCLQGKNF